VHESVNDFRTDRTATKTVQRGTFWKTISGHSRVYVETERE